MKLTLWESKCKEKHIIKLLIMWFIFIQLSNEQKFIAWKKKQPESILASVRFNVCVKLFPWIEHQHKLRSKVRLADLPSLRLKATLIANQSDALLPGGGGQTSISATTTDTSQHVIAPSLHLIPPFLFLKSLLFYPVRRNKLTCSWSEA